jgi:predicted DNA-binding transcriptional regulator
LRRSPDIAWQTIGGEPVIMNLARGLVVGLNPTGALVWSLLEERDEEGLARAVTERFEIDEETARADVRSFLALLLERGLVREA